MTNRASGSASCHWRRQLHGITDNPAFDVTDNSLISAIITEKGICRPPYSESLKRLFE